MEFFSKDILSFFTTSDDGDMAYYTCNDSIKVDINRQNIAKKYRFSLDRLRYMNQVHTDNIIIVDNSSPHLIKECDAMITNTKGLALMVLTADCIGVLFCDIEQNIIAVAHAGRNGTFMQISAKVIDKMKNAFNSNPKNIKVYLGPSIQKCCYEVDHATAEFVKNNFGEEFVSKRNIDLQAINKSQLIDSGVKQENIYIDYTCTKCSTKPYFSYRQDKNCGRFVGVIMIKENK